MIHFRDVLGHVVAFAIVDSIAAAGAWALQLLPEGTSQRVVLSIFMFVLGALACVLWTKLRKSLRKARKFARKVRKFLRLLNALVASGPTPPKSNSPTPPGSRKSPPPPSTPSASPMP
jgi:Flp pilus assembly protein TadB